MAQDLFAARGYVDVSLDDVLAGVHLTKGALYHHFRDKKDLFRAVLVTVQARIAASARAAGDAAGDPFQGLKAVCRTFLRELRKPDAMRIVCRDAGAILTWAECADIDQQHMLAVMRDFIGTAQAAGAIATLDREATTRVIAGAIYQTVEWASHDQAEGRMAAGEIVIMRLLDGLAND
ncbi:MAG: helix-turn-helix domain-containing protein [Sphingopyxis sp.]|uniref:helix-turn-helix domain-containing protein n=1 Tax=Sphingopyxis sp. TaxID=1908224 RepID=UPI002AB858D3|nr:helix-turn-helix domain-containing protein [Sphingopyxis sp.]MDZ3831712.1 helix-turn-helix domain-containing protein [Sphingopyxis sp.]